MIKTLYKQKNTDIDISVLKTDRYAASTWIQIDTSMPLITNSEIDIVGYPGPIVQEKLEEVQGFNLLPSDLSKVATIFPPRQLIVSHGKILEESSVTPRYKLSTTFGMSGSPVIFQGKAVGQFSKVRVF